MRDVTRWIIVAGFVVAAIILAVSIAWAGQVDSGHAQFHAVAALVLLGAAAVLLRARPTLGPGARILMLGLLAFAAAQLVEAVGGLGFRPDGYGRANDLVILHDVGISITPIGLILLGFGVAVPVSMWFVRATSRWIPRSVATVIAAVGSIVLVVFPILTMIGIPIPGL